MGMGFEVVTGRVTNPGAALTAMTPNTGDSFNVKYFTPAAGAQLEDVWGQGAAAQVIRVRSAKFHDAANGVRVATVAGVTRSLLSEEAVQPLFPTDNLTVETTGGAAEVDDAALLIYYRDLPGQDARLVTWEEISGRIKNLVSIERDITLGGTAGDYQGAAAIDAQFNVLKAETDYAILGYLVTTQCLAVGVRGPDLGNFRMGGPGATEAIETRDFFVDLSRRYGYPHIPVFNSNNKGGTFVDIASTAAAGTIIVIFNLAELG